MKDFDLIDQIVEEIRTTEADAINMSFSLERDFEILENAVTSAVLSSQTVIASVGGDPSDQCSKGECHWPAGYSDALAIQGVDQSGSPQGATGSIVDYTAPGKSIPTLSSGSTNYLQDNVEVLDGTSLAAPHVSAIVAMMEAAAESLNMDLGNGQVVSILSSASMPSTGGLGHPKAYQALLRTLSLGPYRVLFNGGNFSNIYISQDVIIPEGSTLNISKKVVFKNGYNIYNYGTLSGGGNIAFSGGGKIIGNGTNNFAGNICYNNCDTNIEYDIVLPKSIGSDYTVAKNSTALVDGSQTVVKSGASLTIKSGSKLVFDGSGTGLKVEQGAKIAVQGSGSSTVRFKGKDGNQWQNIVVRGDSSVLKNVEIKDAGGGCSSSCPALEIAANVVEITNAHIHDNAHAGIGATETDPYQSSTFTLTNSTLRDNGGDGLKASWSNMTLNGNTIKKNAATGISLEGYIGADIQHNKIWENGGDGVYTGYTVGIDVFENNLIHHNGSSGIDTQASQLYAAGDAWNQIYNNGGHEIIVRGNSPGVNLGDASAGAGGQNRIYHVTGDGLGYIYGPGKRYIKNNSTTTVDAEGNYWHREGAYGGQEPEPAMFSGDVNYGQPATEELSVLVNCLPGPQGTDVCTAYPYGGAGDFTYTWSLGQPSQDGKKCQVSCDGHYGGRTLTVTVVDDQGNYATATADNACINNSGTSAYASLNQSALRSDVDSLSASLQTSGSQGTSGSLRMSGSEAQTSAGAQSTRAELPRRTADPETLRRLYLLQRLNARVEHVRSGNRSPRAHPFDGRRGRRIHALLTRFAEAHSGARPSVRPEVQITARELLVENRLRTGKPDEALQRAQKYLDDTASNDRRARLHLMKARAHGQQGTLDRALNAIDRAEALHPEGNEYASVRISVLRSNDDPRWKKIAERQNAAAQSVADGQTSTSKTDQSQRGEEQALPEEFALRAPYPNPSSGQVTVPLALPVRARVRAAVYDVLGRRVQTLAADRSLAAGNETLDFSADGVPNGVYLIRVNVEAASGRTHTFTEKVTVVR